MQENSASHRDVIENRRTILVSFSNNYGYHTILLQKTQQVYFSKVSCSILQTQYTLENANKVVNEVSVLL